MLRIQAPSREAQRPQWPKWPQWLGDLLRARGMETEEAAEAFLHPSLDQLLPPATMNHMEKAVCLLADARAAGHRVVIYGDYDVDGVCASAILWEALGQFGLERTVYIPDRHEEGYGLNAAAVEKLAEKHQVLLTVDCGITSVNEVAAAKERGMAVIVTDHHRHGDTLPPADGVISPLLGDYGFPHLCGAGVAWKLALALLGEAAMGLMDIAALATVADMVPLTGENRVIVKYGLEKLAMTGRTGLRALMNRAGIRGRVTSEQVGFQIAPRMNACGRLESAQIALRLLLTKDGQEAETLALKMESLNQQRRDLEAKVISEAQQQVNAMDLVDTKAIVVAGEGWNSGVVGLAAGRIAEAYAYPTVALAIEGDRCIGSARSAGEVDIHAALSKCADLFERFGGHRQAAGLTMDRSKIELFRQRLSQAVAEQTGGLPPENKMMCDGEMLLDQVTEEAVMWLDQLEPYGVGNPSPRFLCRDAAPLSLRAVGAEGRHLKCTFRQGNALREGIFFGGGAFSGQTEGHYRLAITPVLNEFRGKISAECRIHGMQLLPDTLREEKDRALTAFFSLPLGGEKTPVLSLADVDAAMATPQGTLLVCHCMETALAMYRRYPQADFALGRALDPRACHTVLLYGQEASAVFRRVILCDGDGGEAAFWRQQCPMARVGALPRSGAMDVLLADAFVDVEALRRCYSQWRVRPPRSLEEAMLPGMAREQIIFALSVLRDLGLVDCTFEPFRVSLRPMVKRSPEESALFCLAKRAKEETHGVYSV